MHPSLIELDQRRPGFRRFIGSWAIKEKEHTVIDVGPSNSVPRLVEALTAMGMDRVDWVLLTHVHIDHAGGLAKFLEHYPMARVICHSGGVDHLVDPSKLWDGSKKTLGDLCDTYGPIGRVKREWLVPHTEAKVKGLRILETPGHAAHHLSFIFHGHIFAGEAGGVYLTVGNSEYLRPATPPVFFLNVYMESVDLLLAQEPMPICYGHFGRAQTSRPLLRRQKDQLLFWENIIKKEMARSESTLSDRCLEKLLEKDPELQAFWAMTDEDQGRERIFIGHSIRGYLGFLSSPPSS